MSSTERLFSLPSCSSSSIFHLSFNTLHLLSQAKILVPSWIAHSQSVSKAQRILFERTSKQTTALYHCCDASDLLPWEDLSSKSALVQSILFLLVVEMMLQKHKSHHLLMRTLQWPLITLSIKSSPYLGQQSLLISDYLPPTVINLDSSLPNLMVYMYSLIIFPTRM